jgi:hypothetical protein
MLPPEKIYKYWACEDPDKYWEGREYANSRSALSSANLHSLHVVEATFSLEGTTLIARPLTVVSPPTTEEA